MKYAYVTLAALLSLGLVRATAAQIDFDECGYLEAGVEGGCYFFRPDYSPSLRFELLCDPGDLCPDDHVRVVGMYPSMCPGGYCMEYNDGCIFLCRVLLCGHCCIDRAGNVDNDWGDSVDLSDLTRLIDYLFISFTPPACMDEANVDGDPAGIVDLGDLTALIDYLFITFTPPADCS